MSGHNKWSKIKHKKAATDAKKSQVFSKLSKLITTESKKADGNTDSPGLRFAIEKAKKENMPTINIERAVKKGISGDVSSMESVTYEVYGPGGVALIVEGLTDSKNRTAAVIKHLLSEHGLELAAPGSATWAFTKTSSGWKPNETIEIEDGERQKLESLKDDLEGNDDVQAIYTNAQ
ncbi:YebC/PmpR family DNA-binding transcriptional regulator [Patescibacteria group bacterium]|nr:YebC/PmpR family DNA-binding transcriptional regulator [Patescibacteria group bacterium]